MINGAESIKFSTDAEAPFAKASPSKAKLYSENKLVFMGDGYKAILILINSSSNPEPVKNKFKAQLKLREKPKFSQPDDMEQLRQKALNSIVKTLKKKKR